MCYNAGAMTEAWDPFAVLGIRRDATVEQVRAAYRRAALACHPDTRPEDPVAASRRFYEISEAYRECLRVCVRQEREPRRPDGARATPQDYALRDAQWLSAAARARWRNRSAEPPSQPLRKVSRPTLDETRLFVCLWPLAIVLAVAVAWPVTAGLSDGVESAGQAALYFALNLGVYAAALAAVVAALLLSREIVWAGRRIIGYCARRALPGHAANGLLPGASRRE